MNTLPPFVAQNIESSLWGALTELGYTSLMGPLAGKKSIIPLYHNDYLAIADHPVIREAQMEALKRTEQSIFMSGAYLVGQDTVQDQFEKALAAYLKAEDVVVCQSGYAANQGLIQSIVGPDIPVYIDFFAHKSLWEGIKSGNARAVPFLHNDLAHLRQQISRHGTGVVVVDSIYSLDGSVCPLEELVSIAVENDCLLVVDESHAIGVHGNHGEGLVAYLGLEKKVHFRTASLSKAFVGRAGMITCSTDFKGYLKHAALPMVFSSAMLSVELYGFLATLQLIRAADEAREKVKANARFLRSGLVELGYPIEAGEQIIALEAGTLADTYKLRDALEKEGIFGAIFAPPATPANRCFLRFTLNSRLTQAELDQVIRVCAAIRPEIGLQNWPASLRLNRKKKIPLPV